jgi:tetratricopeptide (TPR) repeat protein
MRPSAVGGALIVAMLLSSAAQAQFYNRVPGSQQADVHNPYSPKYLPLLPNQPIRGLGGRTLLRPYQGGATYTFSYGSPSWYGYYGGYPYSYYPYSYYPYSYGGYGYGYGAYPPAVVLPSETLFGPQAMNRFLGGGQGTTVNRVSHEPREPAAPLDPQRPKVRETTPETKALAGKSIDFGDAQFMKQKYQSALERYREAARRAPDLAEAYFRQGYALVALGQYPGAAKAFHTGVEIGADWLESGFRLDRLYGDDRQAKAAHLDLVAQAIEKNPRDTSLLTVLGVELYFDGQTDRARKFFERAAELGGNRDHLLDAFLLNSPAAGAALTPGTRPCASNCWPITPGPFRRSPAGITISGGTRPRPAPWNVSARVWRSRSIATASHSRSWRSKTKPCLAWPS